MSHVDTSGLFSPRSEEDQFKEIFDILDTEEKGYLTLEQLKTCEAIPDEVLEEIGKNAQQKIFFEDFGDILHQIRRSDPEFKASFEPYSPPAKLLRQSTLDSLKQALHNDNASRRSSGISLQGEDLRMASSKLNSPQSIHRLKPLEEQSMDKAKSKTYDDSSFEARIVELEAENSQLKNQVRSLDMKLSALDSTARASEWRLNKECDRLRLDKDRIQMLLNKYKETAAARSNLRNEAGEGVSVVYADSTDRAGMKRLSNLSELEEDTPKAAPQRASATEEDLKVGEVKRSSAITEETERLESRLADAQKLITDLQKQLKNAANTSERHRIACAEKVKLEGENAKLKKQIATMQEERERERKDKLHTLEPIRVGVGETIGDREKSDADSYTNSNSRENLSGRAQNPRRRFVFRRFRFRWPCCQDDETSLGNKVREPKE